MYVSIADFVNAFAKSANYLFLASITAPTFQSLYLANCHLSEGFHSFVYFTQCVLLYYPKSVVRIV